MVLQLKQHIALSGENPLDARLTEKPLKAYLVANFALNYGVEKAIEQYKISAASIYSAMSFYEDNRAVIEQAITVEEKLAYEMGARDNKERIAEIKKRMNTE